MNLDDAFSSRVHAICPRNAGVAIFAAQNMVLQVSHVFSCIC